MNREYTGESKTVLKHLCFLVENYQMQFSFQAFDEYKGFCGPVNTYSVYNGNGCFTLHQVVQLGEWGWYVSKEFHENQYDLLEAEIKQNEFISENRLSYKKMLKELASCIRNQISDSNSFLGIKM